MALKETAPRLGRGLASLLGGIDINAPAAASHQGGLRQLPLDSLQPNPFQPRAMFDPAKLDELAASIRTSGLLQPILARTNPTLPGRYIIIAGERRWRAAGLAGLTQVPAVVQEMSDTEAATAALVENLQREDLNAIEEAEGYNRLVEEFHLTHDAIAQAIGKSRSQITNALRLLNLPARVQQAVRDGTISAGHARALINHPDPEAALNHVRDQGLTVRQAEQIASRDKPSPQPVDPDIADFERRLVELLGLKLRLSQNARGAISLTLQFSDARHLEDWVARLSG